MRVFFIGYPGELGGACTEAWHTVKLWRRFGAQVHLIPTWGQASEAKAKLDALGCVTHSVMPEDMERVEGLAGRPVVSMCNGEFLRHAHRFRAMGCPILWANCMTFLFDQEKRFFADHGPFEAMIYQSQFQRAQLEPLMAPFGYDPANGHLIRGAFDCSDWNFAPRPHAPGEVFVVGRAARPDPDKWSSNTWSIYERIQVRNKRALMLGMDDRTHAKLGKPPAWADCLKPMAIPAKQFFAALHCLLPVNGGARENWPQAGLEAMAAGVPIVAQNDWGWREMIQHGVTGFLGSCDEELAHYAALLAYDEDLRQRIVRAARQRLEQEHAAPEKLWTGWQRAFERAKYHGTIAA